MKMMKQIRDTNQKLKVGFLSFYHPHMGGSGILATRIALHLMERGHEPHFIGYDTDMNTLELARGGIKLHRVGRINYPCLKAEPYIWTLSNKVCEVHNRVGLDLIHAHYAIPHALVGFVAREQLETQGKDLPYIVTGHGSDIHTNGYKGDINTILRLALNKADAITYVSKGLKKIAEDSLGISQEGHHITNFIETDKFYPSGSSLRRDLGIPKEAFVIGHASNFAPIKQVHHFFELARELRERKSLDSTYFLMVGEGSNKEGLRERIKQEGLEKVFLFPGKLNDTEMREAYNAMDIFVLTSKKEGCPLTILESMACETPVIGTDVEGVRDVVMSDTGFLFKPNDISNLICLVNKLKENPDLGKQLGKNGRAHVEKNHAVEIVMDQYINLYKRVFKKK